MTRGPETIEPEQPAEHAAVLMIHGGFRHLPVVADGKVVGILSIRDLMRGARRRRPARRLRARLAPNPHQASSSLSAAATLPGPVDPARVNSMTATTSRTWWWRQRRCGSVR